MYHPSDGSAHAAADRLAMEGRPLSEDRVSVRRPRVESADDLPSIRQLADQLFSRASGAPLREGNLVALLKDASENYPAWLEAIGKAERTIHCEMYIIHEDQQGQRFADALMRSARSGVRVRLLYDWLGGFGKTS